MAGFREARLGRTVHVVIRGLHMSWVMGNHGKILNRRGICRCELQVTGRRWKMEYGVDQM